MLPRLRRPALLLATLLALASLASCDNSDVSYTESTATVQLLTGAAVMGVTFDLQHSSDLGVMSVAATGPIASAGCSTNIETGRTRGSCVSTAAFSAPVNLWTVTIQHPTNMSVADGVTSLTCTGSDVNGSPVPVTCALSAP